jgi:putative AbiEi antitoxin of type IV toxin-antitoxin system/uncharacterized protein DUF559
MNGKVVAPDESIGQVAGRQYGVISTAQLRRLGLSDDAVRARVLAGRLYRVHRGVYAVGHRALPFEARCLAAVLAIGGGPTARDGSILSYWKAAVSHRSAASLWELLPPLDGPLDVIVRRTGGRMGRKGIRVHCSRSLAGGEVTLRRAVPVTTPTRTIADLRRVIPERHLRRAKRQAEILGLPLGPGQGDRTRSDLEGDFLDLCECHPLPPPEVNVPIGSDLVDFLWRAERLVVETDSYLYHRGEVAFQDDRKRDLRLKRAGYEVLHISERQLNDEPELVAETVAAAIRERSGPRA